MTSFDYIIGPTLAVKKGEIEFSMKFTLALTKRVLIQVQT
jgi:hypothetical protein